MSETTTPLKEHHWVGLVTGILVFGLLLAVSQEADAAWLRATVIAVAAGVLLFAIHFFHHGRKAG